MSKRIHLIGMITIILYFLSVGSFLISRTDMALTIWELMTVISGPVVLFMGYGFGLMILCMIRLCKE